MQINVAFRHTEPSDNLRNYAEEKISRVKKYLEEPIEANVVLKVEKFRHCAEVSIVGNGIRINGVEETEDMYSAIDMVADKIESQVKKTKDKSRRRKPTAGERNLVAGPPPEEFEPTEPDEPMVIETEQVFTKPMDEEEAMMQLRLSGGEFLVFHNRNSNRINVLYRRKDGHYGLIEAIQ